MERIECEQCYHSHFEDDDKLRCRLKECQPDYEDMIVAVVIQLEKMLEARRENESSSGISFSSNNG